MKSLPVRRPKNVDTRRSGEDEEALERVSSNSWSVRATFSTSVGRILLALPKATQYKYPQFSLLFPHHSLHSRLQLIIIPMDRSLYLVRSLIAIKPEDRHRIMSDDEYESFTAYVYRCVGRSRRVWHPYTNIWLKADGQIILPWTNQEMPIGVILRRVSSFLLHVYLILTSCASQIRDYAIARNSNRGLTKKLAVSHVTRWVSSVEMVKDYFEEFHVSDLDSSSWRFVLTYLDSALAEGGSCCAPCKGPMP